MSLNFRRLFNTLFHRNKRSLTVNKMDSDGEDSYYAHHKIANFIHGKPDKVAAIKEFLAKLPDEPVLDFPKGLEWFNVSEPLSFSKHLKGKVVVLDFFTYCCINCMHVLPDLKAIEEQFSVEDGLVVIGVHSAKFANEKISSNILSAVQRYNISHPVVNDNNSFMWKNCDVHCWPTLLLLGPNANPIAMLTGEGHRAELTLYIKACLEYYKEKNQISSEKLPFKSAYHLLPDLKGPLLFPGKIVNHKDSSGRELFAISDSGNHRILIITPDGEIIHQIGVGKAGFKDGSLSTAEFNSPQGLTFLNENTLFIADTENHALRKIDLAKKSVETVAGTGAQGYDRVGGKLWKEQIISSPWDVCIFKTGDVGVSNSPEKNVLIIAMAGTHQIWALFLDDIVWWKNNKFPAGTCLNIAGSGREENRNNSYPQSAGFAQPSGLALCSKNKEVYIADSESSSVRRLSLVDGKVTPVVGGDKNPNNLFAFGDLDGTLFEAKLQHSLGLAISPDESTLFIADTYNHKVKKVDISQNRISTLSTSDTTDGAIYNEPAGLCLNSDGNKLYLADTNNHSIKILNLNNDYTINSIKTLDLNSREEKCKVNHSKLPVHESPVVNVSEKGGKVIFKVNISFKDGLKLTEDAPQKWSVKLPDATWACVPSSGSDVKDIDVVASVPKGRQGFIDFVFDVVTCTEETCFPKSFVVHVPIHSKAKSITNVTSNVDVILGPNDIIVK